MSYARTALLLAATIAGCSVAQAQSSLSQPPRFDSPGCGGIMCRQRDPGAPDPSDPAQAAAAAAYYGPPCGGILCEMDPRGMRAPMTAADAQEAERRRQEAAASSPQSSPPPMAHARHVKAHRKARRTAKAGVSESSSAK